MHIRMIPAACAAATLSLGLMFSTAHAGNDLEIKFDRDALVSTNGAKALLRKIERQAKAHCGYRSGPQLIKERQNAHACVEDVMARAVEEIDDIRLTSVFEKSEFYAGSFSERG